MADKIRQGEPDAKLLEALREDCNKSFREVHYQDFMRDVLSVESLVARYRQRDDVRRK